MQADVPDPHKEEVASYCQAWYVCEPRDIQCGLMLDKVILQIISSV
jgi:hypothetical protein